MGRDHTRVAGGLLCSTRTVRTLEAAAGRRWKDQLSSVGPALRAPMVEMSPMTMNASPPQANVEVLPPV